jgi:hypothetical protein
VNAVSIAKALAAEPDPIFAAIERHDSACHAHSAVVTVYGRMRHGEPGYIEAEKRSHEACHRSFEALADLLLTEPTTFVGAAAVLEYVGSPQYEWEGDGNETIMQVALDAPCTQEAALAFLPTIAATLRRLAA